MPAVRAVIPYFEVVDMIRMPLFALLGGLALLVGGATGQEPKKLDVKPAAKEDAPKAKGFLPQNWGKIGLSDDQKQLIYKAQAKSTAEIEKLEAKIKELKAARDTEMKAVLTPDQKKKLEEILTGKAK